MGKFSTLSVATSGLIAAQTGLYVTGHNMANVDTLGFTRQQSLQNDYFSVNISRSGRGINQIGLGTDVSCIRQIRDQFLDISYRKESGRYNFYLTKANTGFEIESILGELQSQYNTDSVIKDLFNSLQELSFDASSISTRGNFISTAVTFVDKVSNVYNRMRDYQYNLNEQIKQTVVQINQLTTGIEKYNRLIMDAEMSGDNANDYRDSRNVCLDQLSHLLNIEYKEMPDGRVNVMTEGKELVVNGVVKQLGLRYCGNQNSFVEPVFTNSPDILAYDNYTVQTLFDYTRPISGLFRNDSGHLKGLMVSRGMFLTTYASEAIDLTPPLTPPMSPLEYEMAIKNNFNLDCMIPKMMKMFDTIVHEVVTLINDAVAPQTYDPNTTPYDLNYDQSRTEIFKRKYFDRYDANDDFIPEDLTYGGYYTLYTAGNLMINPLLLEEGGYNLIALMTAESQNHAVEGLSDNTLVLNELLSKWKSPLINLGDGDDVSVDDAYRNFISLLGVETSEAMNFVDSQSTLLVQVDNKRQAISAVSLDEEMRNMMIYQHAYNAAARVINTVDSMIDKIVNGTGRAGL